ncbi:MAG: TPD domain-containing protein [Candidatus Methanofastidiosia archaeon]
MRRDRYYKIYRRLESVKDIPHVAEKYEVNDDILYSILSQKIVKMTKKDYHIVARQSAAMLREWNRGKSLLQIAEERKFSPVLISSFILKENGLSKRDFKQFISQPDMIKNKRLKDEIIDVLNADFIYSPSGSDSQRERGISCECRIQEWLDVESIPYMTEDDSRKMGREKTPDFLFHDEQVILGKKAYWFESKGSFGSPYQAKSDYNKQFKYYVDLFGPGIVAYWAGFVDDISLSSDIIIVDKTFFEKNK